MPLLAFLAHPPPSKSSRPTRKAVTCLQKSLVLIPDHFSPQTPSWYKNLQSHLPQHSVTLLPMPNPYDSNSKRWEAVWLSAIRDAVTQPDSVSILGHGTGADAALRFLEGDAVGAGVVLIAPTGDEYFAGERHGRAYHWELISGNVGAGVVLVTSALVDTAENQRLANALRLRAWLQLPRESGRFVDADPADVARLVELADAVEAPA